MAPDFAVRYAALGSAEDAEAATRLADASLDESLQHFFEEVLGMHEYLLSFRMQDGSSPTWPTPRSEPISLSKLAGEGR